MSLLSTCDDCNYLHMSLSSTYDDCNYFTCPSKCLGSPKEESKDT